MELINWVPFNRISEIISCFKEVEYEPKELIIQEGTYGDKFYVVKSGIVELYSDNPNNFFVKRYQRGDYFGESAVLEHRKRMANVIAITKVVLLEIHKLDFSFIFDFNQKLNPKFD